MENDNFNIGYGEESKEYNSDWGKEHVIPTKLYIVVSMCNNERIERYWEAEDAAQAKEEHENSFSDETFIVAYPA